MKIKILEMEYKIIIFLWDVWRAIRKEGNKIKLQPLFCKLKLICFFNEIMLSNLYLRLVTKKR
jgi:hypothetical protein